MSRLEHGAAGIVAITYLILAAALPLPVIDRTFLPDDTYYTLSIARNIAAGLGPTVDGVVLTSGFQPLIAILLQPVFWLGLDGAAAVRSAVLLSAAFGGLTVWLAGRIVRQATTGGSAPLLTILLTGASTPLMTNALNGLETTLAASLLLWLVLAAMATGPEAGWRRLTAIGALAGLCLWARVDTALTILLLGGVALVRLGPARTGLVVLVAAAVAAPWVWACMVLGGQPVPESGSAVRQIVAYHFETGRDASAIPRLALAQITLAIMPLFVLGVVLWPMVWLTPLVLALPLWQAFRARCADGPAVLAAAALAMLAFYALYLPAFWFYPRYMHLTAIAGIVGLIVGGLRLGAGRLGGVFCMVLIAGQATQSAQMVSNALREPQVIRGGHGYADAALTLLPLLPEGATLAAMQSGALSWFAPEGIRVVNLDGVVNAAAREAIRDERLGAYLAEVGATHFADWPLNLRWLRARGGEALDLERVGAMPDHGGPGGDFTLYRIE